MSAIEQEVASQPAVWREAGARLETADLLPRHGARVARGRLRHVALHRPGLRRRSGRRPATARRTPSRPPSSRPAARTTRVLAISRSGTTTEVLDAVAGIGERMPTVAITRGRREPARAGGRAASCCCRSPTSARSSRPGSPRRRSSLLRAHLGIDPAPRPPRPSDVLERPLPIDPGAASSASTSSAGAGRSGWRTRRRSSCARRPAPGARRTRRWSTGTGRSPSPTSRTLVVPIGEHRPRPGLRHPRDGRDRPRPRGRAARLARARPPARHRARHARGLDPDNPRNLTRSVVLP